MLKSVGVFVFLNASDDLRLTRGLMKPMVKHILLNLL